MSNPDEVRCRTCGRPWEEHTADCPHHAFRPGATPADVELAKRQQSEAVERQAAYRRGGRPPLDAPSRPVLMPYVQLVGRIYLNGSHHDLAQIDGETA